MFGVSPFLSEPCKWFKNEKARLSVSKEQCPHYIRKLWSRFLIWFVWRPLQDPYLNMLSTPTGLKTYSNWIYNTLGPWKSMTRLIAQGASVRFMTYVLFCDFKRYKECIGSCVSPSYFEFDLRQYLLSISSKDLKKFSNYQVSQTLFGIIFYLPWCLLNAKLCANLANW